MSRDLESATSTAAAAEIVNVAFLARLGYDGGDALYASTPFDIAYDWEKITSPSVPATFFGVGDLAAAGAVEEGTEVAPYSLALTLTGIDPATISVALQDDYQNRPADIWVALLDGDNAIIGDAVNLFAGRMDTQDIQLDRTSTITVTARSRLADWRSPRVSRYTNEDQQSKYPGDLGFEFVPQMVAKELVWGRG